MIKYYIDNQHNMHFYPPTYVIYHARTHNRLITFSGIYPTSTTFTTNDVSLPLLLTGEYSQLIPDSNSVLHTVGYIKMSLYTDASGNVFAQDSSGNDINNKLVDTTTYTYPYTDIDNNYWDGYFTTYFSDGTYFGNNDTNDAAYWYTLEGLGKPPQQYT